MAVVTPVISTISTKQIKGIFRRIDFTLYYRLSAITHAKLRAGLHTQLLSIIREHNNLSIWTTQLRGRSKVLESTTEDGDLCVRYWSIG